MVFINLYNTPTDNISDQIYIQDGPSIKRQGQLQDLRGSGPYGPRYRRCAP